MAIHKVFNSYHHDYDQKYKEALIEFGKRYSIFVDRSVDTGDIPDIWTDGIYSPPISRDFHFA